MIYVPGTPETEPIYQTFITVALQIVKKAQEATDELLKDYPGAETVKQEILPDGSYHRVVVISGQRKSLMYDFRSKEVAWVKDQKAG